MNTLTSLKSMQVNIIIKGDVVLNGARKEEK